MRSEAIRRELAVVNWWAGVMVIAILIAACGLGLTSPRLPDEARPTLELSLGLMIGAAGILVAEAWRWRRKSRLASEIAKATEATDGPDDMLWSPEALDTIEFFTQEFRRHWKSETLRFVAADGRRLAKATDVIAVFEAACSRSVDQPPGDSPEEPSSSMMPSTKA